MLMAANGTEQNPDGTAVHSSLSVMVVAQPTHGGKSLFLEQHVLLSGVQLKVIVLSAVERWESFLRNLLRS